MREYSSWLREDVQEYLTWSKGNISHDCGEDMWMSVTYKEMIKKAEL